MRRTVLLGALLGLACGPGKGSTSDTATTEPASTTHGSETASASTAGESTAVDPTVAPTTGDSTTGTVSTGEATTGDPECAMYQPEEIGPGLDVTIRHEGNAPVWVRALDCSGLVVTAKHVVAGADLLVAFVAGSDAPLHATVVYTDPEHDIAFVHIGTTAPAVLTPASTG